MKIKALLATLIGAVALQGATAGEWCPPVIDKCPVECCDELPGSISVGYDTDYIFYGVRLARDVVWADVNYTFDLPCVGLPVTIGAWHLSSLGSGVATGNDGYGDETNLYAAVGLPSICGFDMELGYKALFYPTTRGPRGTLNNGGDSQNEISLTISREIFCGVTASYRAAHDFNIRDFNSPGQDLSGSWIHTIGLDKTIDISDCIALDLSGGVLYSDNYWANQVAAGNRETGWNNYYIQAALPIAVGQCATLTPYLGYSGTPDTWVADGINGLVPGANRNDVFPRWC